MNMMLFGARREDKLPHYLRGRQIARSVYGEVYRCFYLMSTMCPITLYANAHDLRKQRPIVNFSLCDHIINSAWLFWFKIYFHVKAKFNCLYNTWSSECIPSGSSSNSHKRQGTLFIVKIVLFCALIAPQHWTYKARVYLSMVEIHNLY